MSGQKKLNKVIKHIRVIAMPSKKMEVVAKDAYGNEVKDKNGMTMLENVQLYNIFRLR